MQDKYLMGIDAGTSNIKAVLFGINGEEKFIVSRKNKIIKKYRTWTEQDMNLLWENFCKVIKEIIEKNNIDSASILSIGITGQGEGCWLIDSRGSPVRNAILWSDARAVGIVEKIKEDKEKWNRIKEITGSYAFSGATSIILRWLKENESENLKKAYHCLFCKDWLRFKLTGDICIDVTDASTSILDLNNSTISDEVMDVLEIKEYRKLFKDVVKPYDFAGKISKEAAELTGLCEGTTVAAGMMDVVASAVGIGAVKEGDCCTILGTTCCNEVVRSCYKSNINNSSGFECHAVDKLYLNVIASMAGTPNLDWIIDNFFIEDKRLAQENNKNLYEILEEKIKNVPVGSGGIIYHPYISTGGERAPFFNANARAQFFGISNNADRYYLLKAVYEGIALSIKDCLQGVESSRKIYLGGGGAKSFYWAQIISDCTACEVIIPSGNEFAAKGAALAAGVQVGVYNDIAAAALNTLKVKRCFTPRDNNTKIYEKIYRLYRILREVEYDLWNLRKDIFHLEY
ncbi:FGGY-family carbohydrate kinase [Clostridium ganghwense]|uniref:Carbohydrate kinase n=1 Tax=Clostridium ganghwense TaxID=312089 RepID=A0ABT4CS28_9CLOT|nr:FGGY-family carbohydrate kinase [Clostridium ganghwense]MCY6370784.1 carbohydrate kinase [Clostridium ganghwense]